MSPKYEFPPGPRRPAVVQAANVMREPHRWLQRRYERFGDVFSSRFPFYGRVVYLAEPQLAKDLLTGDPTLWHSGEATASVLEPVLGSHSVLTLDEDAHMAQRKLLLPPFHGERVRRYGELMADLTAREVEGWPDGEEIELRSSMQAVTLEVILRTVFGVREERRLALFREPDRPAGGEQQPPRLLPHAPAAQCPLLPPLPARPAQRPTP